MAKHTKFLHKCPFYNNGGCALRHSCEDSGQKKPCPLDALPTRISGNLVRVVQGIQSVTMPDDVIIDKKEFTAMIDKSDLLLRFQRDGGYALYEVDAVLILTTRRTSAKKVIGVFPKREDGQWPLTAIWTACDIDDGRQLVDYSKIDMGDPKIRDRVEHGVYRPNPDDPARVRQS